MGDAARQLPAGDPLRAELYAMVDRICDLLRAATPTPAT